MVNNLDANAALTKLDVCQQGELQHLMVGRWFGSKKEKYVHIKFTRHIRNSVFLPVCHTWVVYVYSFVHFVLWYFLTQIHLKRTNSDLELIFFFFFVNCYLLQYKEYISVAEFTQTCFQGVVHLLLCDCEIAGWHRDDALNNIL